MAQIILKDGSVADRRLDRIPFYDKRSLDFRFTADNRKPISKLWPCSKILDQGQEGACAGFGTTHGLIAYPLHNISLDNKFAKQKIYWPAQKSDPWAGGSYPGAEPFYEGTTVLAALKQAKKLGYITHYRYVMNVHDLAVGIGHDGVAVVGIKWFEGMYNTDKDGFVRVTGNSNGGHCVCYNEVDAGEHYFGFPNSWGRGWGRNGFGKISFDDMDKLLNDSGEAAIIYGPNRQAQSLSFWQRLKNFF
jgi:hypothetical protein